MNHCFERRPEDAYRRRRLEQTTVGDTVTVEEMELLFGAPIPGYGRLVGGTIRFALPSELRAAGVKESEIPDTIEVREVVFQTERYLPPDYSDPEVWPKPCRLLRWRRVR